MGRQAVRAAFILYQFVLFNVVLPGHTRGAITLPGTTPAGRAQLPACCAEKQGASKDHKAPTSEQRACCAICFFAARVCQPVYVDYSLTKLGLLERLEQQAPQSIVSNSHHFTYDGRGPPVV